MFFLDDLFSTIAELQKNKDERSECCDEDFTTFGFFFVLVVLLVVSWIDY